MRKTQGAEGKLHYYNAAVSAQDSAHVPAQLDKVFNWSLKEHNQSAPDYMTLFIGANDVCNEWGQKPTPTATYKDRIAKTLHRILSQNRKTKVLVMELPKINDVWKYASTHKIMRRENLSTCALLWRRANLCQSVLTNMSKSERTRSEQQVAEYNRALKEVVRNFKYSSRYGRDRVRFAPYKVKFSIDKLAVDCFHPNWRGQSEIAVNSFQETWWAKDFNRKYSDSYNQWVQNHFR